MNLRDLAYLLALAEYRHFGRAADASFVSQPTLSTQIKKLEEQLDGQLVERNSPASPADATCEQVAQRARTILAQVDAIKELARQNKQQDSGTLVLGVFPTLGPYWLAHVVPRVVERFPKLQLLLVEEKTETLIEQLAMGKIDVAVLAKPVDNDQFESLPLFDESFVLAVPRTHPLADQPRVRIGDLAKHSLLLLSDGHCLREQALSVCALAGTKEQAGFRATSLETLRHMVAAGVGATLLPALATLAPVPPNPALSLIPFAPPQPMRSIAMFWRQSSARTEFYQRLAPLLGAVPEGALAL